MKHLIVCLFIANSIFIQAQVSPVKWSFKLEKKSTGNFEFLAEAKIDKGWNIYSINMEDGGPIPTAFTFDDVDGGSLNGKIKELTKSSEEYDELFEMKVMKLKSMANYSQPIDAKGTLYLKGMVTFMCCDSKRCLPPTNVPFSLKSE